MNGPLKKITNCLKKETYNHNLSFYFKKMKVNKTTKKQRFNI